MSLEESPALKFTWYQHVWMALPISLVFIGGAIGGLCGGVAWAVNRKIFSSNYGSAARYLLVGLVSISSIIAYFILAAMFIIVVGGVNQQ